MAFAELISSLSNADLPEDAKIDHYKNIINTLNVTNFGNINICLVSKLLEVLKKDLLEWTKSKCFELASDVWILLMHGYREINKFNKFLNTFIYNMLMKDKDLINYNLQAFIIILQIQNDEANGEDLENIFKMLEKNKKQLVRALRLNCKTVPTEMCFKYIHLRTIPQIFSKEISEHDKEDLFNLVMEMPPGFANAFMTPEITEKYKSDLNKIYIPYLQLIKGLKWWNYCKVLIHYSGKILHSEIEIMNSILKLIGLGFKTKTIEDRCGSYECWKVLIENYNLDPNYIISPKRMKLLIKPLVATLTKNNIVNIKRFEAFAIFIEKINNSWEIAIKEFLDFCFGPLDITSKEGSVSQGQLVEEIYPKSTAVLLKLLGHKGEPECCGIKSEFDADIYDVKQFVFPDNLLQHIDMILKCIMVSSKLSLEWNKLNIGEMVVVKCLWFSLLKLFKQCPESHKEKITEKLFEALKEVIKTSESHTNYHHFVGKTILKTFVYFLPLIDYNKSFHDHLVTPLVECFIVGNMNNPAKFQKPIFPEYIAHLLQYCKGGDFIKEIDNLLQPKYEKSELIGDVIAYAFHYCVKVLSYKLNNFEETYTPFLLNILMHSLKQDSENVSHIWTGLKLNLKKLEVKFHILDRLKSELKANPRLICKMIAILPNLFEFVTKNTLSFFNELLAFTETCLATPLFSEQSEPDFTTILKTIIELQNKHKVDSCQPSIYNCFESVIKVHKAYNVLSILLAYVTNLTKSQKSVFPVKLRDLIFDLSVSASEDISIKAIGILAKLESSRKSVVISSNSMSRAAKIATMAKNSNSPNSTNITNLNVLRLFGQDMETLSPLKVKGSLLDKDITPNKILLDSNKSNSTPTKIKPPSTPTGDKMNKIPSKPNQDFLNELSESQFVVIDKEVNFNPKEITEHQKEVIRRQREEIPALYEGLSQSVTQSLDVLANPNDSNKEELSKTLTTDDVPINKNTDVVESPASSKPQEETKPVSPRKRKYEGKQVEDKVKKMINSKDESISDVKDLSSETEIPNQSVSNSTSVNNNCNESLKKIPVIKEDVRVLIKNIYEERAELFDQLYPKDKNINKVEQELNTDDKKGKPEYKICGGKDIEESNEYKLEFGKTNSNELKPVNNTNITKLEKENQNEQKKIVEQTNVAVETDASNEILKLPTSKDKLEHNSIETKFVHQSKTDIKVNNQKESDKQNEIENQASNEKDSKKVNEINEKEAKIVKDKSVSPKKAQANVEKDQVDKTKSKRLKRKIPSKYAFPYLTRKKIENIKDDNIKKRGRPRTNKSAENPIRNSKLASPKNTDKKTSQVGKRGRKKKNESQEDFKKENEKTIEDVKGKVKRKKINSQSDLFKDTNTETNKQTPKKEKKIKEESDADKGKTNKNITDKKKPSRKRSALENLLQNLKMDIVGAEEYENQSKRVPKQKSENVSPSEGTNKSSATKKEAEQTIISSKSTRASSEKESPIKKDRKSLLSLKKSDKESRVAKNEVNTRKKKDSPNCESEDIIEGSESTSINCSIKKVRVALFNSDDESDEYYEELRRDKRGSDFLAGNFDDDMQKKNIEDIIGVPKNKINLDDTETIDMNDFEKGITNLAQMETLSFTTDVSCQSLNLEITPNKAGNNSISGSPVTSDTPRRNSEFLNNTLEISPIKTWSNLTAEQRQSPDIFSNNEDDARQDMEYSEGKREDELINDLDESLKTTSSTSSKLPNSLPNTLMRSKKTFFENSIRAGIISSPKTERVRKMMQNCEENNKSDNFPVLGEDLCTLNSVDVLKFDREVPGPLATPKISILKRKLPDFNDEGLSPMAKRKRVNFSDPPTTSEKIYFKEIEENSHFKKKKKTFNMLSHLNKCMNTEKNLDTNVSIRGMQNTIEGLANEEVLVSKSADNLKSICENGVNYLNDTSLGEADEPSCSSTLNLNPPSTLSFSKYDGKYSLALEMLEQTSKVIKTNFSKEEHLEIFEMALLKQLDPEERTRLGNALIKTEGNQNNL